MVDRPAPTEVGADPRPAVDMNVSFNPSLRGNFLDTRSRNLRLLLLQLRQVSFGSRRQLSDDLQQYTE